MLATLSNLTKDGEPKKKHAEIKVQENRHRIKVKYLFKFYF